MGGGGHVIIQNSVRNTLSDPLIHGALPNKIRECVDNALAKDDADWTYADRIVLGHGYAWALCHI